jgi:parallel beta-helix repeat protein
MTMLKRCKLFVAVLFLLSCPGCGTGVAQAATTYYVSKSGNDSNSCTSAKSTTLSAQKATINAGLGCLASGDTLLVHAGSYDEFILDYPIASGTSWSSFTRIAAYPGETVWMRPAGCSDFLVYMNHGQQYLEFDGINMDASTCGYGVLKLEGYGGTNANHIRLKNAELVGNVATNFNRCCVGPVLVMSTAQDQAYDGSNEFLNLKMHHNGNLIDNGPAFYLNTPNNVIDGVEIYDVTGTGIQLYSGYGWPPSNNIIRNSRIHDIVRGRPSDGGHTGWAIILEAYNTKIYNNIIYNNTWNGTGVGIFAYWTSDGTEVYNNTVYNNTGNGIELYGNSTNNTVRNNIAYSNGVDFINDGAGGANVVDHNLFGVNPKFVNAAGGDFHLQAGSPGVDTGVAISSVTTDIAGGRRPQGAGFDMGAYEGAGSAAAPKAPTGLHLVLN